MRVAEEASEELHSVTHQLYTGVLSRSDVQVTANVSNKL
jgi:hypothetical protein